LAGNVKFYSYSGSITSSNPGSITLTFSTESMYAKIVAILDETSNTQNHSILQFECCSKSTGTLIIWNIGVNGQANSYPWNTIVTGTSTPSVTFNPNVQSSRNYTWYLSVQVMMGTLISVTQDSNVVQTFNF
jgi:hypothetical protein